MPGPRCPEVSRRPAPRRLPRPARAWGSPAAGGGAAAPRPPRAGVRPADLGRLDLGAGAARPRGRRPGPPAGRCRGRSGAEAAVGRGRPDADGVGDRGQQDGGGRGVADGAGVELVHAEHGAVGGERRAEHRAEGHGAATGLDDRDGLGGGHLPAPAAREGAQRLGDRPDRAEVGAGADDDLAAGGGQPADGVAEVRAPRRRAWSRVVTSLAPTMIRATSGCSASAFSTWASSSRDSAPGHGHARRAAPVARRARRARRR